MSNGEPGSFPSLGQSRSNIALDAAIQLEDEKITRTGSVDVANDSGSEGEGEDEELDVIQERMFTSGHDDEETKFYNNQLDEQVAKRRATSIMKRSRNFNVDGNFEKTIAIPIPRGDGRGSGGDIREDALNMKIESVTPPAIAVLAHMQAANRENASSPFRGLGRLGLGTLSVV